MTPRRSWSTEKLPRLPGDEPFALCQTRVRRAACDGRWSRCFCVHTMLYSCICMYVCEVSKCINGTPRTRGLAKTPIGPALGHGRISRNPSASVRIGPGRWRRKGGGTIERGLGATKGSARGLDAAVRGASRNSRDEWRMMVAHATRSPNGAPWARRRPRVGKTRGRWESSVPWVFRTESSGHSTSIR